MKYHSKQKKDIKSPERTQRYSLKEATQRAMYVSVLILGTSEMKLGHPWSSIFGAKIGMVKQVSSKKE